MLFFGRFHMLLYYVFFGLPNKARRGKMENIKRVFFGLRRSFWQKSKKVRSQKGVGFAKEPKNRSGKIYHFCKAGGENIDKPLAE